jgi:hypothetical protein
MHIRENCQIAKGKITFYNNAKAKEHVSALFRNLTLEQRTTFLEKHIQRWQPRLRAHILSLGE